MPDGRIFFYTYDENAGLKEKKERAWILAIATYIKGKLELKNIPLKTPDGSIITLIAKNGYILFIEGNEDSHEIRLEKIHY